MATIAAVVVLAFDLVERLRRTIRHRLPPPDTRHEWAIFAVTQLGAGAAVALLLVGYEVLLGNAISATSVDALHFSLHPLVSARLAFALGLLLAQAVVFWSGIVIVVLMTLPWRAPRSGGIALAGFALQALPVLAISLFPRAIGAAPSTVPALPTAFAGLACLALAWGMVWVRPRYRHASQALRLFAGALVLLIPAFVLYPSVHHFADRGLRRLIEEEYARQAKDQRPELQAKLRTVLQQIDALDIPNLSAPARAQPERVEHRVRDVGEHQPGDRAPRFVTRAVRRAKAARGRRFALEPSRLCLDDADAGASRAAIGRSSRKRRCSDPKSAGCSMPAAASASADSDTPTGGSIVVNVMLDYDTLPFITARNPYNELIRPADSLPPEGSAGRVGAVRRLRMGPRIALLVEHARVAARRHAARRHRAVAAAVLDDDERWRAGVFDLHPERSRRHLRDRLPCHHAARSPDQPGGADDTRRAHVRGAAGARVVGVGARRHHGDVGPRAAARGARQLLPQAVSRVPRGVRAAGHGARVRHAHVFRAAAANRACSPMPSASPPSRSASSRSTWRCRSATPAAAAERRHHGVAQPRDRSGREHLSEARRCSRRASATCSTRACCPSGRRATCIARSRSSGCRAMSARK